MGKSLHSQKGNTDFSLFTLFLLQIFYILSILQNLIYL